MKTHLHTIILLLLIITYQQATARETQQLLSQPHFAFISNAGQITDQHKNPRKDIDYKLTAPGIDIFIGNGQLHYQWIKNQDSKDLKDGHANRNLDSKFPLPAKEGDRGR